MHRREQSWSWAAPSQATPGVQGGLSASENGAGSNGERLSSFNLLPLGVGTASMLTPFPKPWALEQAGKETKLQRLGKVNLGISAGLALPASPHRSAAGNTERAKAGPCPKVLTMGAQGTRERSRQRAEGRGTMRQC